MSRRNIDLGCKGETAAASFLKTKGYKIICTDYRTKLGQIDIIARENNTVCFVEVKTRTSSRFGAPDEAVQAHKQKKISESALIFLKDHKLLESPARFDVVSVSYVNDLPQLELVRDAFTLDDGYTY
jgi:putative endonuclease